jgi:transcriptional regulator with XRE-family HTH domain
MDKKDDALRKFGKQVAALRAKKGLTVRDLAFATGLEQVRIARIEAGKVNLLFTTILVLAKALEVSPDELLSI